jgi:uncharacterized protein (TIGR01777 family)
MPENQTGADLQKNHSVLITGGSGLIGKHLTSILVSAGYNVSHLSGSARQTKNLKVFLWDSKKSIIDPEAFEGVDFIVHLAGANIGAKRWSGKRKEEIIKSRVESARLIHKNVIDRGIRLKGFITASATGIYGSEMSSKIFSESDPPAKDFLGSVCEKWETAANLFDNSGIRTVKIRTGVVLGKNNSALSMLMKPGKFGFLIQAGNGLQYMPWIHIADLCNIYLKAIEDRSMNGVYNAVAPQHVTHGNFMRILGKVTDLPVLPVPLPGFVLRTVFGEMSDMILKGNRVSSEKIVNSGYSFLYKNLEDALINVMRG